MFDIFSHSRMKANSSQSLRKIRWPLSGAQILIESENALRLEKSSIRFLKPRTSLIENDARLNPQAILLRTHQGRDLLVVPAIATSIFTIGFRKETGLRNTSYKTTT